MLPKNQIMEAIIFCFAIGTGASGCSPFVPVVNIKDVPPDQLQQSYRIKTYTTEAGANYPEVEIYIGDIVGYSCKLLMTDPPASKGDALTQLRLKALELGADGIINITFDSRGTDTFGTNCWESVQASGVAVKFSDRKKR